MQNTTSETSFESNGGVGFWDNTYYTSDYTFICKVGETRTESYTILILNSKCKSELRIVKPYSSIINTAEFCSSLSTTIFSCEFFLKATVYFESAVFKNSRPIVIFPIIVCHKTRNDSLPPKEINEDSNVKVSFESNGVTCELFNGIYQLLSNYYW